MSQKRISSGDSDCYAPSEASSFISVVGTPPQRPKKAPKIVMEVVIPVPKSTKRRPPSPVDEKTTPSTGKPKRRRVREPSPARSDSSVSLGTYWYEPPKKKRTRTRRKPSTTAEGEQVKPRKRPYRRRNRSQALSQTAQNEHIPTTCLEPVPSPAIPVTADVQSRPRSPSVPPFKPRARPISVTPRVKINLESARLETIQAQESARGYDIYHCWPTPPGSDTPKPRVQNALNTPTTSSPLESRARVYTPNDASSSTGLGTLEYNELYGERGRTPWGSMPGSPKPPSNIALLSPLMADRLYALFPGPAEAGLGASGPEVNKLARSSLQTALRELVEQYHYPLENVSKLLEKTGRELRQLRTTQEVLKVLVNEALGDE
ncbi:hypothetical protein RSOLAG22IIIB_05725 [Rhizoctonia solani]|uniref:Uncharacterized protein n=1 Tax=Rhizoctonia solani TaxID=456999 RepID=A0A0K6G8L1_9AGAM|nr:hypothetical protein RSOLAG22IIIB_05725 [Rhizoctonia solani]